MGTEWMGRYRPLVAEIVRHSNITQRLSAARFPVADGINLNAQEWQVFEYILDHCHRNRKYCVIHTKDAEARVLEMLKSFPDAKPIIHWYDGPVDIFKKMLEKGYYTTFGCQVLYSDHIKELLKMTPMEQVLSETDNPDSEKWLGGTDDTPLLIQRVVRDIASVKGISESACCKTIYGNSRKILARIRSSRLLKNKAFKFT